jgi:hypothetical protein
VPPFSITILLTLPGDLGSFAALNVFSLQTKHQVIGPAKPKGPNIFQ